MPLKVIEFQDETGDIMVARVPQQGTAELISRSQLIVQQGQVAAFFHDGRPADIFGAGRHQLKTQNLPVLSKMVNVASWGRSPFRSHVYYVAMKTFTGMGWGTSSPLLFRDSEFKMVHLRAHGSYAVRIADARTFLQTVVGTQGHETTFAIEGYLRSIIISKLAQVLPSLMTSVIDLPARYEEIGITVKAQVHDHFGQYGLELVDLVVEAITVPQEVQEAIDRATGSRAVGNEEISRYERVMRSEALRDAAKQPGSAAGAGLAAGMGIGAGMAVAREMGNAGAAAKPTMEEVRQQLHKLKEFLDEGLITQEDFEAKKNSWLEKL